MRESRKGEGVPEASEGKGRENREEAVEADERVFLGDVRRTSVETKKKAADALFDGARDLAKGIDPEAAAELRPFLERAAASSDLKTTEAAKEALARLDLRGI